MLYEDTEQGLIQVNLGYLADRLRIAINIGLMEKDEVGQWIVPISTPGGIPSDLSSEQFAEELAELAGRLQAENQLDVRFILPKE